MKECQTTTIELPATYYDAAPMVTGRTAVCDYWRQAGDVYRAGDVWYVTSYDGVRYAQTHPELFSSAHAFDAFSAAIKLIPIAIDPPEHVRFRRILDPMLGPSRMKQLEESLRAQVRKHIDAFADRGHCDVVADLAVKFPTQAILTLFGFPQQDLPQFLEWVAGLIKNTSVNTIAATPTERQVECSLQIMAYMRDHIESKRAHPRDDMLSNILTLDGEDAWTEAELLGLCFLFIVAGLDTVTGAIGFCMLKLAQDTALRAQLIENPALIPSFVEEVLRLEGPVPVVPRVTTADVEIAGTVIPSGARVLLVLATANREGPHSDDPQQIYLSRPAHHLAFGGGIHRCLGAHLARREMRLTIEEFHRRIPDYRLASAPTVVWPAGTIHLESLPLTFPPG
jgi:cytochrome P450